MTIEWHLLQPFRPVPPVLVSTLTFHHVTGQRVDDLAARQRERCGHSRAYLDLRDTLGGAREQDIPRLEGTDGRSIGDLLSDGVD